MQGELQQASLEIGISSTEVPTREHGRELASWIMRRCPDVLVRYLQPEGTGVTGDWGVLCFAAPGEDELWEAVLAWMVRGTGPWPVPAEPERPVTRAGHSVSLARRLRRWLKREYTWLFSWAVSVSGRG